MTRDELETAVWRALAETGYSAPAKTGDDAFVGKVLAAADAYATTMAAKELDRFMGGRR